MKLFIVESQRKWGNDKVWDKRPYSVKDSLEAAEEYIRGMISDRWYREYRVNHRYKVFELSDSNRYTIFEMELNKEL